MSAPDRTKPFVPLAMPAPLPLPELCACDHPIPAPCLAKRHGTGVELAEILGGCSCPCHCTKDGVVISVLIWYKMRYAKQREIERVLLLNESRAPRPIEKKESMQ